MVLIDTLNTILVLILFLNASDLFIAFVLSYKKMKSYHVTALDHLQLSWLSLALFWFALGMYALFQPLQTIDGLSLITLIVICVSPFILQIYNFYLSLFSNRIMLFETYFPTFIGIIWGIAVSGFVSNNSDLKNIVFILLPITSLFFVLYCILTYLRLLKMKKYFTDDDSLNEIQFLTYVQFIVIFSIIGGGIDLFFPAIVFSDFFNVILIIGLGLISLLSFLFIYIVRKLVKLLPIIDLSLIINELN